MSEIIQLLLDRAEWNANQRSKGIPLAYAYTVGDEKIDRDAASELTQARAQVAQLRTALGKAMSGLNALRGNCYGRGFTEGVFMADETIEAIQTVLSALPSSPDINGEMLDALLGIRMFGELGCVQINNSFPGGKKPASKDVWQFPRHLLTGIDEAIARAKSQPSTTGEG